MRRVAVFARRPHPGKVKTRLSPALPAGLACDLYRAMLADAFAAAAHCQTDERWIYWTGDDAGGAVAPTGFQTREQQDGDLGDRLDAALAELLPRAGDRAVIIGADCPDLDAKTLDRAFARLEERELVLGPTGDGGYYLIGLARQTPGLLKNIAWSTEQVFAQTIERARAASLSSGTLDRLDDLDTPHALLNWIARESTTPSSAGANTATALARFGLMNEAGKRG